MNSQTPCDPIAKEILKVELEFKQCCEDNKSTFYI